MKYQPGDRVRVSEKSSWAKNALGTIAHPPPFAIDLVKDEWPWIGWHRPMKGKSRWLDHYWVDFDIPQIDADGDGPYYAAELEAEDIEKID